MDDIDSSNQAIDEQYQRRQEGGRSNPVAIAVHGGSRFKLRRSISLLISIIEGRAASTKDRVLGQKLVYPFSFVETFQRSKDGSQTARPRKAISYHYRKDSFDGVDGRHCL